jgi:hypothetical protein
MSISQKPLRSESGFASPGFIADTYGNINITGDFKVNGVNLVGGANLPSTTVNSNLTSVGTLVALTVTGMLAITGNGVTSSINNTLIGNVTPLAGTFTTLNVTTLNVAQINNTLIGNVTPLAGTFTTLNVTTLLNIETGSISIKPVTVGSLDNVIIGGTTPLASTFTKVTITQTPATATDATTKNYVDNANATLKKQAAEHALILAFFAFSS